MTELRSIPDFFLTGRKKRNPSGRSIPDFFLTGRKKRNPSGRSIPDFFLTGRKKRNLSGRSIPDFFDLKAKKIGLITRPISCVRNFKLFFSAHHFFFRHQREELVEVRHDDNVGSSVSRPVLPG